MVRMCQCLVVVVVEDKQNKGCMVMLAARAVKCVVMKGYKVQDLLCEVS